MNNFLMREYLDTDQLKYDFDWSVSWSHQRAVLFALRETNWELLWNINQSYNYLNTIWISKCWAKHHKIKWWFRNQDCILKEHNAWCCHTFDFWISMENSRFNTIGTKLFAHGYVLSQNWEDVPYFLGRKRLQLFKEKFRKIDSWPLIYLNWPVHDSQDNLNTKIKQLEIGSEIISEYLKPIRNAMDHFIEQQWIILDQSRKVIPIQVEK